MNIAIHVTAEIRSIDDAAREITRLEAEVLQAHKTVTEGYLSEVRARLEQGRIVDRARHVTTIKTLAERLHMGRSTLFMYRQVFLHFGSMQAFEQQRAAWEEEGRRVTWSMVRAHAEKSQPEEAKPRQQYEAKKERLLKKAERLELEASALAVQAEQFADDDGADVAEVVRLKVEDVPAQFAFADPRPVRVEAPGYLSHVRKYPCVNCGGERTDAHHLDRGGMGTKGSDFFTVPLCRTCHSQLHKVGEDTFWGTFNPWRKAAELMADFLRTSMR